MFRSVRTVLVLLLSAIASPGQTTVCVTGVIQPQSGPSICASTYTHELQDTLVKLRSRSIDLRAYVGHNVKVVGVEVGATCHILEVLQVIDPAPATLTACGLPMLGCQLKLKVCPIGMGQGWLLFDLLRGYAPLGCASSGWLDGTLLLAQPFAIGPVGPGLCGEFVLTIPQSSALLGLDLWFQGARRDIGPIGPLELTNVVGFRVTPFLPPCAPINC